MPSELRTGGSKARLATDRWTNYWLKRAYYGEQAVARLMAEMKTRARLHLLVANWEANRPPDGQLLAHHIYGHLARARLGLGVTLSIPEGNHHRG